MEGVEALMKHVYVFPVVGLALGALIGSAAYIAALALPANLVAVVVILAIYKLCGINHIDGLADTLDGLMGGRDHSSRLAIMKDSRLGTAGALGIFFALFMKYLCLNNLFETDRIVALLVVPALARWSQTLMVSNAEYGRENGLGKAFVGHLRSSSLAATSAVAIGLSAFVVVRLDLRSFILFFILICGVPLFTYLGKRYVVRKLGGVTGDAIGAMSELNEVVVLLLFVILSSGN